MTIKVSDESIGTFWNCRECGKESKRKHKIGEHIENHLDGFKYVCPVIIYRKAENEPEEKLCAETS